MAIKVTMKRKYAKVNLGNYTVEHTHTGNLWVKRGAHALAVPPAEIPQLIESLNEAVAQQEELDREYEAGLAILRAIDKFEVRED